MVASSSPKPRPRLTLHGCFKGCLTLIAAVLLIYIVGVGIALATITANYNKWVTNRPRDYSVIVKYGTYAGFYNSGREVVRNGILASSNAGFSQPAIDRLFDAAKMCAFFPPVPLLTCHVEYDPRYGYPSKYMEDDLDMGRITEIGDLMPE